MSGRAEPDSRPAAARVRDLLLLALAVSAGAVDAISFLALGKVFTAFATGNIVFLGLRVGGAGGQNITRVMISLACFALAAFVAVKIVQPARNSGIWPRRVSRALVVTLVAQAAFFVLWLAVSGRPSNGAADGLVALSAIAMGMQSLAIMSLGIPGILTTAATATYVGLFAHFAGWRQPSAERHQFAGVLFGVFVGATCGALLLTHARNFAPLLPLVMTSVVLAVSASIADEGS